MNSFSDEFASKIASTGPIGNALHLARAEAYKIRGNKNNMSITCPHCPYESKSYHEASLHARLHPRIKLK